MLETVSHRQFGGNLCTPLPGLGVIEELPGTRQRHRHHALIQADDCHQGSGGCLAIMT